MKTTRIVRTAIACSAALLLASCGGGGDATGKLTPFNIVPAEVTLTGPDAQNCGGGYVGRVFIFGGAGPYRLLNTAPDILELSRSSVGPSGGSFDVLAPFQFCSTTGVLVVVQDQVGRQAVLTVKSVRGAASPAPPASAPAS